MSNYMVSILFGYQDPYTFIQSVVGYRPYNGVFPEVRSLVDLQLVVNRLIGEDSDFLTGLHLLAKRMPLAKAFLIYLRNNSQLTDSNRPKIRTLLNYVVQTDEEKEWLERATHVPIILSKQKYIQWLKINPQTKIEKWSREFLEATEVVLSLEERDPFLKEVYDTLSISLVLYEWFKNTFKTINLKEEERAIIARRREADLTVRCCVCYTDTGFVLPCTHSLCLCCKKQIQNNRCPLCRALYDLTPIPPLEAVPPSNITEAAVQGYITLSESLLLDFAN